MNDLSIYKTYANDVLSNNIIAGKYIHLACQRYLSWFDRDDMYFDVEAVNRVITFIAHLKHFSGKTAGKPFILEPWQKWIVYNIYGWKYKDTGLRVTTKVFILVARKNGKSAFASALSLYELLCGPAGSQCYNIASAREQAQLLFQMELGMGRSIDPKGKYLRFQRDRIFFDKKHSYNRCLASDTSHLDGLSASMFIADETHAYKGSNIWDVLISSQGFVSEPLAIQITTAGFLLYDFCYNYRQMCTEILQGVKQDDSQFSAIYELDENDSWQDEKVWVKANPNIDVTITSKYIREQVQGACNAPSLEVGVRTKSLNQWVSSSDVWIPSDMLLESTKDVPIEFFRGRITTIGVDLAAVSDLTAVSLCALDDDGKIVFKTFYYIPSSCLENNVNAENYKMWKRRGLINVCPGNVTDYDYILKDMLKWRQDGVIIDKVAYDQYNSTQWAISSTEAGLPLEPFSQALWHFNRGTKELERQIKSKNVVIDNNEITRWCFSNVALKYDHNENCKPVKGGSESQKIDGVISSIEAFATYIEQPHYNNLI